MSAAGEAMGRGRRGRILALAAAGSPYAVAVAASLWLFRTVPGGRLIGDVGDARWTITFHEHWFDVWRGRAGIRELRSWAPEPNMLGATDPLLAQGQIYSAARAVGFGYIAAWTITQFAVVLVGAAGTATLARRLLRTTWARCLTVAACVIAYPIVLQMGHVQLLMMLWPTWVVVAAVDLARGRARRRSWWVLCLLPPLIAVSSWYVAALGVLIAVVYALVLLALTPAGLQRAVRRGARAAAAMVRDPWMVGGAAASLLAWCFVAWVFLPASRALPPADWAEALPYLPQWSDLWNASGFGGGVWRRLYRSWYDAENPVNNERAEGFTPVLLLGLAGAIVAAARSQRSDRRVLLAAGLTCAVTPLLFLVSADGWSLFKPLWLYVPGVSSLRSPFRSQAMIFVLATFVVAVSLERWWWAGASDGRRRAGALRAVLAVAVLAAMLVETERPTYAQWRARELLAPELRRLVPEVRARCSALIVVPSPPGSPPSLPRIDATVMAMLAEMPTPQGHGRADPNGSPGSDGDPVALAAWMHGRGFSGPICLVSIAGIEQIVA